MRKRADYTIDQLHEPSSPVSWYVYRSNTQMYLFRDGRFRDWDKTLVREGGLYTNDETHFGSKAAASRALNKYLKG